MAALIPNNRNRKRTFSECDPVAHQQIVGFLVTAFNSCKDKIPFLERDFTKSSMILPTEYNNAVIPYVYEKPMLDVLERKGVINWNRNIRALLTMFADDDGNSLAHSVSLYIFGIQDKEHHLRQLIYQMMFMQKPNNESIIITHLGGGYLYFFTLFAQFSRISKHASNYLSSNSTRYIKARRIPQYTIVRPDQC